jgi:hypothetical protein
MIALHIGGASTASVVVTLFLIFFLIFAVSFAFGKIPEGHARLSPGWTRDWFRASLPRLLVAGVFAGALGVAAFTIGDNSTSGPASAGDACSQPVAPLTRQPLTDQRLAGAIAGMGQIAAAAAAGETARAQALFFTGDTHNVTHDIDSYLRDADSGLARDLCLSVVVLENQMAGTLDANVIEREAVAVSAALTRAGDVVHLSSTATPVQAAEPCAEPIGAVTNEPLTAQRISAAVASMREIEDKTAAADPAGLKAIFFGDAHNITHDIDYPLRQADPVLAVDLCLAVLELEREMSEGFDRSVIKENAADAARLLDEAGRALGIAE